MIRILEDAKQKVNPKLAEIGQFSSFGRGRGGRGRGGRGGGSRFGGGRDFGPPAPGQWS